MRQPLEDRVVTIARATGSLTFPASFQLVAAMNPCPCGYHGDPVKACSCSPSTVTRYQKRISGPLLDRIDIHIEVPAVDYEKLSERRLGETSAAIRQRVEKARQTQRQRFAGVQAADGEVSPVTCNADMRPAEVRKYYELDDTGRSLMKTAMNQLQLSARAYHRVLKLARTIADLAGSNVIGPSHLAEALQQAEDERGVNYDFQAGLFHLVLESLAFRNMDHQYRNLTISSLTIIAIDSTKQGASTSADCQVVGAA